MDPLTTPWGTSQHDARGSATKAHAGKAGRHQETTTATAGRGGRTAVRASRRPCRRRSEGQGQWPWGAGRGSRAQWAGDAASSARRGATRRGRGRGGTTRWRRRARRWRRCTGLSSQGIDSRPRLGSRLRSQGAAAAPGHQGSPRHRVDKGNKTQGRQQEQGSHVHQPTRENPAKRSAGSVPAPTPATGQRAPMAAGRQKRNPGGPQRRRVKALRRRPGRPHHDRVLRMETNGRRRRGRRLGRKKRQHMQTTQTERKGTAYPPH